MRSAISPDFSLSYVRVPMQLLLLPVLWRSFGPGIWRHRAGERTSIEGAPVPLGLFFLSGAERLWLFPGTSYRKEPRNYASRTLHRVRCMPRILNASLCNFDFARTQFMIRGIIIHRSLHAALAVLCYFQVNMQNNDTILAFCLGSLFVGDGCGKRLNIRREHRDLQNEEGVTTCVYTLLISAFQRL